MAEQSHPDKLHNFLQGQPCNNVHDLHKHIRRTEFLEARQGLLHRQLGDEEVHMCHCHVSGLCTNAGDHEVCDSPPRLRDKRWLLADVVQHNNGWTDIPAIVHPGQTDLNSFWHVRVAWDLPIIRLGMAMDTSCCDFGSGPWRSGLCHVAKETERRPVN